MTFGSSVLEWEDSGAIRIGLRRDPPRMRLMQFVVQLIDLHSGFFESLPACGRNAVKAPRAPCGLAGNAFEQARALQSMKQRVKRSRPDAIAVMRKLLHHRQPEDRLVARVQQHVNANQAVKKFPLAVLHRNKYTPVYTILP